MYPIFVHVHKFTLFKLKESSNSTCCKTKQHLELGNTFDYNIKFQAHPNGRIQIEANSFPSWNWNLQSNSIPSSILCSKTQCYNIFPNSATFYELGKVTTRM
jgi:hypothetical protein